MSAAAEDTFGLVGDALEVMLAVRARFPWARVTSGRRDREAHARALADNELAAPGFIVATYVESAPKRGLLAALSFVRSSGLTRAALYRAFLAALNRYTDGELRSLSAHYGGHAADFAPELRELATTEHEELEEWRDGRRYGLTPRCKELAAFLAAQAVARGGKFLAREGGLIRLHWQARRSLD